MMMIELPEPLIVRGATLGCLFQRERPHVGLVASIPIEHIKASNSEGVTNWASVDPPLSRFPRECLGRTLYAGPLVPHFGHVIAEYSHRLWAETFFGPFDRIVFQVFPGEVRPAWADAIFRACAVNPDKVFFVEEETRFEELHVPKQGRALGGATLIPNYEVLFPLTPIPIDPNGAKFVYVSRSRQVRRGTYFGEELVERSLADAGFRIVHPEDMSLPEILTVLRSASLIVFTEGSAIHNLELIGRLDAKVLIIGRRYGSRGRFIELLKSLVKARDFYGDIEPVPPFARLSIPKLLRWIADHAGFSVSIPSEVDIERAIAADMRRLQMLQVV